MNEDQLKEIWQADETVPAIDFTVFQNSLRAWQNKLQRRVKIDIWAQIIPAVLSLGLFIYLYPKMVTFSILIIILGVWYVRELRRLGSLENNEIDLMAVREVLNLKLQSMKRYFRRTRLAMYAVMPFLVIAVFYDMNVFSESRVTWNHLLMLIAGCILACEISIVILTEIYFRVLYTPAFRELEDLSQQLSFEE